MLSLRPSPTPSAPSAVLLPDTKAVVDLEIGWNQIQPQVSSGRGICSCSPLYWWEPGPGSKRTSQCRLQTAKHGFPEDLNLLQVSVTCSGPRVVLLCQTGLSCHVLQKSVGPAAEQ